MPFYKKNTVKSDKKRNKKSVDNYKSSNKQKLDDIKKSQEENTVDTADMLIGRNAVREALKNNRDINKLLIAENAHGGSLQEIISLARSKKVIMHMVSQNKLDSLSGEKHNQGILAYTPPVDYADFDVVLEEVYQKKEIPFFILLDELEDPHNLGAVLRTADAVGAHGVIIAKRRSCPLSSTVAKTSAGAIEYVPVIRINNMVQMINKLKKQGFWVAGADAAAERLYYNADLKGPLLLVIGSEGKGISRLIKESCDFLVKLPMRGKVNSLNASNAAAVLMYEVLKQRTNN